MKNLKYFKNISLVALLFLLLAVSCKDESDDELLLSRQFSPAKISSANDETLVTLTWSASLFTLPGEVTYDIEVSDNASDFSNPAFAASTTDLSLVITDDKLAIKKDYYARVRAQGTETSDNSNWLVSSSFRILGEQFLTAITTDNIIDKGVRLYWRAGNDLTRIVVTPTNGGTPVEATLTDADRTATMKIVGSLTENTPYTAEIFAGTKTKGTQTFTTKSSFKGNVIDLTGTTGNPGILVSTLATAPSGSIIVLKRGENYDITSQYLLSKSVMIVSGMDYGTAKAIIRSSASFSFAGATTVDSVVFKDLIIRGGRANRASYDSDYLINSSAVGTTIGRVRLENCTVKILRGLVRGQSGTTTTQGTKFSNYLINNCVIDSLKDFSVATASGGSSFTNIKITNSTIYKVRKMILHQVAGNSSITMENCTLNEIPGGTALATTNFLIDFNTATSGTVNIKNTIFGKVWDELGTGTLASVFRSAGSPAVTITNAYSTSDFSTTSPLSGLSAYSGASTVLYTDPANGNFKIKDANFIGKASAGDPRWR